MARIIKNGEIVADPWCLLAPGAEALGTVTVIKPQLLLPLARWAQELELLEKYGPDKILGVANKCDLAKALGPLWPEGGVRKEYAGLRELGWIDVSAKFGQGIDALAEAIRGRLLETGLNGGGERDFAWNIAPNLRQAGVLKTAGEEIDGILEDLSLGVPYDLVGVRVELLSAILAEVSGEIAAEDVLDRIFSEFCLGK